VRFDERNGTATSGLSGISVVIGTSCLDSSENVVIDACIVNLVKLSTQKVPVLVK